MSSRMNQWFVLGDGIAREVITADIQRYLGPDALVRPGVGTGEYEGRPGYWITAYRTLTSQMIQDLKLDSQRWQAEKDRDTGRRGEGGSPYVRETKVSRDPNASLVAYQDSRTHASRQHYGPSDGGYAAPPKAPNQYTAATYAGAQDSHYTTAVAPQAAYGVAHAGYGQQPPPAHVPHTQQVPRTDYTYGQQPAEGAYAGYQPAQYQYAQQAPSDPYRRSTTTQQQAAYQPSTTQPAPGYYIASDGRQYPLAQQPGRQQPQGRRG